MFWVWFFCCRCVWGVIHVPWCTLFPVFRVPWKPGVEAGSDSFQLLKQEESRGGKLGICCGCPSGVIEQLLGTSGGAKTVQQVQVALGRSLHEKAPHQLSHCHSSISG